MFLRGRFSKGRNVVVAETAETIENGGALAVSSAEVSAGDLLRGHYEIKKRLESKGTSDAGKARLAAAEAAYDAMRDRFTAKHGAITKQNIGETIRAGVYYTSRQKLFVVKIEQFPAGAVALERLMYDIDRTVEDLGRLSSPGEEKGQGDTAVQGLGERLGSLATVVLAEIDLVAKSAAAAPNGGAQKPPPVPKERLALLKDELQHIQALHREAVIRQVKLRYLTGLSLGVSLAFVFCLALTLMEMRWPVAGFDPVPVAAVAAGAVGAAVSVMMRIGKRGAHWLDANAGPWMIERLGVFRPVIGGILGAFAFFAVEGGLIPLRVPAEASVTAFFVTVAFLTGFSERMAKNLLSSAQKTPEGSGDEGEEKAQAG